MGEDCNTEEDMTVVRRDEEHKIGRGKAGRQWVLGALAGAYLVVSHTDQERRAANALGQRAM